MKGNGDGADKFFRGSRCFQHTRSDTIEWHQIAANYIVIHIVIHMLPLWDTLIARLSYARRSKYTIYDTVADDLGLITFLISFWTAN